MKLQFFNRESEHDEVDWSTIKSNLEERYSTYNALLSTYPNVSDKILLVDVMVEHANEKITARSKSYFSAGRKLFTFGIFLVALFFLNLSLSLDSHIQSFLYENPTDNLALDINPFEFTLILMRKITASGVVLGLIYIVFATANSCFREATILLHRRHAMRYVRLCSYMNHGKVDRKGLQKIFGVDDVTNTGFERIRTESMRDNLIGKLIEAIGHIYKGSVKVTAEKPDTKPDK